MGSQLLAVLVISPIICRPGSQNMAVSKFVAILLITQCAAGARQLRGNRGNARGAKSLVNTFPFNSNADADHHENHGDHGDHGDHHEHHAHQPNQNFDSRLARQGDDVDVSFPAVAAAGPGADGKKCIDKVEMVEETEYDDVVQCDHSYDKRCHTTYVTNYESQQEEDCEENFRKSCFIEYEQIAFNETVAVCRTPLVKDCDIQGPEICRTEYESERWTKQEVHDVEDDVVECKTEVEEKCEDETSGYTTNTKCSKWPKEVCSVSKKNVKKYTPITGCTKEPRELCAPAGCGFKQGAEECYDKTQTVVQDAPNEECVDVPKEVCTRSRTNPRKVKKPVVKKWCY